MSPVFFRLWPLILLISSSFAETATVEGRAGSNSVSATITVIADSDGDGLTDEDEVIHGTNPQNPDSDSDGISDYDEVTAGTNPLANQFLVDPDWRALPSATAARVRAFWDFEAFNNNRFASRKGSFVVTPTPAADTVWNQTDGMLGKSARLGPHAGNHYLQVPPNGLWTNHQSWTMALSVKFASIPSFATLPLFSVYSGAAGSGNQPPALQISLMRGVPWGAPPTSAQKLFFRVHGTAGVFAEWIVENESDLSGWADLVFAFNGQYATTGNVSNRKCYINGKPVALSTLGSYDPVTGPGLNAGGYVLLGATKVTSGTLSVCPVEFSVDRWIIAQFNNADLEIFAKRDTDGDGMSDYEETTKGSNLFVFDADLDHDGLTRSEEDLAGTKYDEADSDGDGYGDAWEVKYFYAGRVNPNLATVPSNIDLTSTPSLNEADYDNDGLTNREEHIHGTNPNVADTDGDGIGDKAEADYGSDPGDINDKPFKPSDFYGDEGLGSFSPIGDLGATVKSNEHDESVRVAIGVDKRADVNGDTNTGARGAHWNTEIWQLNVGGETVTAPSRTDMSTVKALALDKTDFHVVTITSQATLPNGDNNDELHDYHYNAIVDVGKSPFILCDLPDSDTLLGFKNDVPTKHNGQISSRFRGQKKAYLVPLDNYSWASSYSGGDAVGPQHRKVSLSGRPLADDKPQQEEETDEPAEETYIDAFNLSLHHDTTFHYMPLGSSDLVLQASMSTEETGFSDRSGLRPKERFDLPFGAGWSSNLCSYVEVVETLGDESNDPVTVNVVDEAGRPQRFGTKNFQSFFPWPSSRVDKKTYLNTLARNGTAFTLQKKFGNTLTYQKCKTWFMYSTDRLEGSTKVRRHTYWRLAEVRDRYGVRLQYKYDSQAGEPNDVSLIPREISSPDRPGQFLVIDRDAKYRRVDSITDSRGNKTKFHYNNGGVLDYKLANGSVGDSVETPLLTQVTFADQTSTFYGYSGGLEQEIDASDPANLQQTLHYHANVSSITDKRGNTHGLEYSFDSSKEYWDSAVNGTRCAIDLDRLPDDVKAYVEKELADRNMTGHGLWKQMYGLPRQVAKVTLPGGFGYSEFAPSGQIRFGQTVQAVTAPATTVTDANHNVTVYEFNTLSAEVVDVDVTDKSVSKEWMVYYLSSSIHHGGAPNDAGYLGTETYDFDLSSGLSLWKATDMSGNQTMWFYDDGEGGNDYSNPAIRSSLTSGSIMSKWPDPVAKIDALGRREDYTYSDSFRVMSGTDDPYRTLTTFTVDGLGRRIFQNVAVNGPATLKQERYGYGNQRFKAFQTAKTIIAFDSVSNQAWEKDLVSQYLPDTYGRLWREIADASGEKLVTEHTYDFNNNRTSTLDPRKNRTRYKYDKLNRLVEVTFPVAGTRGGEVAATKQTWYNANGSTAAEIDEEGNYTIHHYDALNRRIATIRDMDRLGLPTRTGNPGEEIVLDANKGSATGNDLVTLFEYDSVGYLIRQTDPRGIVTRTFHDAIGRPTHIFTGLTATEAAGSIATCTTAAASAEKTHTEFRYTDDNVVLPIGGMMKGNPGGTAFDSSGFKPTEMIRYGAVKTAAGIIDLHTYAAYDGLYRPLRTETEYESGVYAVSTTAYGSINSQKEALETTTTDDRGKVTRTLTDGLQRPVSVTDAHGTALAAKTETIYSSTGLVWKTIDPLERETETEYDTMGRAVCVWQPDPVTGLVNRANANDPLVGSPRTRTAYDNNGNVTVTLNPLGHRWEYEYDARNRRTLERQPTVTETEIVGGVPEETAFQHPEIVTAHDGVGTVIAVTDAREHVTRSFHDRAYRVTHVLTNPVTGEPSDDPDDPGANDIVIATAYDANGNAIEVIDGNGNITRNQYDRLNRLVATAVNPADGQPNVPPAAPKTTDIVVSNQYDDAGNLVKVIDGETHVTGFRFDGLGRKTRTIWDEGSAIPRAEEATFDGLVQLTRTDAESRETAYHYDALNRLEDVLYEPDIDGESDHPDNRHNGYDLVGNLLEVSYPNETTAARKILRGAAQEFDALNRLTEETSAGSTHVHTYDKAGNRRTTEYAASGRFLSSTYDKLNRLLTLTEKPDELSTEEHVSRYSYDLNGNVTRKVQPNGSGTLSTFDALNRKLTEQTRNGGGTGGLVSTFDYSQSTGIYPSGYDNAGNVLKIVEDYGHASVKDRVVTNAYDRAYRLVTETAVETGGSTVTTTYDHDKANNRTQKVVTGGSNPGTWIFAHGTTADGYNSNQVKSVTKGATVTTFLYDLNGNRTEKKVGGTTVQTYGFDHENRLTSLADSVKGTFAYSYDHRTRRVGRDESGASGTVDEVSFASGLSVQEYINGSGTPTVEYVRGSDYGGGIGGVLYTIRGGNARSYNAYNSRGDVVSKTDQAGAITWQSSYEAFGTRTQEEGDTDDRQKANTKDEDPTGLLNEGMRYRDLEFGIFLTRDPAGFVDGPNVYTYVRQNPWTTFDPHGLDAALRMWDHLFRGEFLNAAKQVPSVLTGGIAPPIGTNPLAGIVQMTKNTAAVAKEEGAGDAALYAANSLTGGQQLAEGLARTVTTTDSDGNLAYQTVSDREGNLMAAEGISQMVQTSVGIQQAGKGYLKSNGPAGNSAMETQVAKVEAVATEGANPAVKTTAGKSLLPGEGAVGTYDDLIAAGAKGDNITPHHIPSANHMAQHGVPKGDGIAINMEQPFPGSGGRHRATFTYGTQADLNLTPRQALGRGIWDARSIYRRDGLYSPQIRSSLQDVSRQNRAANPSLFKK